MFTYIHKKHTSTDMVQDKIVTFMEQLLLKTKAPVVFHISSILTQTLHLLFINW